MVSVPFPASHEIHSAWPPPSVDVSAKHEHARISNVLAEEMATPLLDALQDHLWFVARSDFQNIDALHRQLIKGRNIFVTEDSKLHMVWDESRIFLKPIPLHLMSYKFWEGFLSSSSSATKLGQTDLTAIVSENRARVLGFLRSYAYLIRHHSDFVMAQNSLLLPNDIDWQSFDIFISHFREVRNAEVAPRYWYGQLRLSRLNWAVRIFRPPEAETMWFYELPHWSTMPYVKAATVPLVFAFAGISLIPSSMQVMVGIPAEALKFASLSESGIGTMDRVYWVFSLITIMLLGVSWVLFLAIPLCVFLWQFTFGCANRGKRRSEAVVTQAPSHGMPV